MTRIAFALALCLSAAPLRAEEPAPPGDMDEGMSLIEEGARLFFRGLIDEMEPAMRDMAEGMDAFVANLEPMLRELARMMGDFSEYHAPEMLPNGDIIIRRKRAGEPGQPEEIEI